MSCGGPPGTPLLTQLHRELEAAGIKPGTPAFAREERSRRVQLCKELRAIGSCWDCSYFDHCDLIKTHLRDLYGLDTQRNG